MCCFLSGESLLETGESMRQIADIKYNLDDNMKMNFLEPLHNLSNKDVKEVMVSNFKTSSAKLLKERQVENISTSYLRTSIIFSIFSSLYLYRPFFYNDY